MSKQKIKLEVEGLKLEPLKFFMGKAGKNLEEEIVEAMDKMYEKYVPVQAREFIDHQIDGENQEPVQEVERTGNSKSRTGSSSKPKRGRTQTVQQEGTVQETPLEQGTAAEEQTVQQGITQQM